MIKVSIILPSLNVVDYIEECIRSVMNQTLLDIEIISVDAGSKDGTVEILKKCKQEDSRIKLITSDIKSYGKQVNMGIEVSNGQYIAILETDDYVSPNMYENLYNEAISHNVDFVLADFDRFFVNEKGIKEIFTIVTWEDEPEIYGKVLTTKELGKLYNLNPNLWRGIYQKDFITKNNIKLNETLGAAYQDICYMHRVIMHAKKALFVPESYYRYRTDREGSSVNSIKGLQYSYQEYKVLLENNEVIKGFEPRVYCMMSHSFIGEITQIYSRMDECWKENNILYYTWFRERILEGIEQEFINEELLGSFIWKKLKVILGSLDNFLFTLQYPGNTLSIVNKIRSGGTIIFAAGKRGCYLFDKLKNDISFDAFCDNNELLWYTKVKGKYILPLEKCINKYPENNYLITIKDYSNLVVKQLIEAGVSEEKIYTYMA